ncbi:MAG: serine/threonine protein kinase, bacterial [Blastocatellia bacterium]|nr:serine/threonine protein kinase, bacterial [Blastocatellia bacterium]
MTTCCECGANIEANENFCGGCGARRQRDDTPIVSAGGNVSSVDNSSGAVSNYSHKFAEDGSTWTEQTDPTTGETPADRNRGTGEIVESTEFSSKTSRVDAVPDKRPKPKALAGGKILNGRYEIVRRIGGGGMGAVYLAKDRNLGEAPRAVKEMIESHIDDSQHEKAVADFKRESLLLTELEHPSIPTVYDYFYDDASERFYLVMKFIPGSDLSSRLRNAPGGRIDELTVTEWGIQVADVLHYLHTRPQSIIYRDLKPANLMIDSNSNRIMLIDFGIARWVNKKEKGVTAVGTMGYAPPELFSGQADPRVDIYSLGATMFHLLTGSDPQDNPLLIFDFTKNPRPRQINPALSSEMERLLIRTVEYKPEHRFQSGAELREALAGHLEKLRSGQVSYGVSGLEVGGETQRVAIVFCGFCGGRIAADDVFCAHCGSRQPMGGASSDLAQARATAKLVVSGTTELDASFVLQRESNLVGRTDPLSNIFPEVDLSRFDPQTKVSRRHARIWREGEAFMVEDLGSVNGTVINDIIRLEPRQPRPLDSGDRIRLGETTLHFLVG